MNLIGTNHGKFENIKKKLSSSTKNDRFKESRSKFHRPIDPMQWTTGLPYTLLDYFVTKNKGNATPNRWKKFTEKLYDLSRTSTKM